MANAILRAARASKMVSFMWYHIRPYTPLLFGAPNSPSTDSAIILLSPYIGWGDAIHSKDDVIRWASAASAVPYTEEVGRGVLGALLRISRCDSLRPHIPIEIWRWLNKHSTLPLSYQGPRVGVTGNTVRYIRGLGDIKIFKSYLLLAWSEHMHVDCFDEIRNSFEEDFCGIGMWGHRKDLTERLELVLGSLGQGDRLRVVYAKLRGSLVKVETEAMGTLIGTLLELTFFQQVC